MRTRHLFYLVFAISVCGHSQEKPWGCINAEKICATAGENSNRCRTQKEMFASKCADFWGGSEATGAVYVAPPPDQSRILDTQRQLARDEEYPPDCDHQPLGSKGDPNVWHCECVIVNGHAAWWAPIRGSLNSMRCSAGQSGANGDDFTPQLLEDFRIQAADGEVEVCVWDHECEDGDILAVTINGSRYQTELANDKQCRTFRLQQGRNPITAYAVNGTGYKGSCSYDNVNTGTISVSSVSSGGGSSQVYKVHGGQGTSANIEIYR